MEGYPAVNPRVMIVNRFRGQLDDAVLGVISGSEVSSSGIALAMMEIALRWANYAVKDERSLHQCIATAGAKEAVEKEWVAMHPPEKES